MVYMIIAAIIMLTIVLAAGVSKKITVAWFAIAGIGLWTFNSQSLI
jgi:cell division protein FtsW